MMPRGSDQLSALLSGRLDDATPEDKQIMLLTLGGELAERLVNAHLAEGVQLAPLEELYLRERLRILAESPIANDTIRLYRAFEQNITSTIHAHHAWRHAHHGNVVWEFSGPTGSGKSSAMLGLLERYNHVKPEDLKEHVTIDVPALPTLLPKLAAGSGLAVDEQSQAVGEGSVSQQKTMRNIEDQLRYSMIDIYWASPQSQDHSTSQGEFVAIATHYEEHYTRFLVYLNDMPLGYANLPWCSPDMWRAYAGIKGPNTERAKRAAFHDPSILDDHIRRLFEVQAVQKACHVRRLKVPDWRRLLKRHATTLNTGQIQTMAEEIEFMMDTLLARADDFDIIYGWKPTPSMKKASAANSTVRPKRTEPDE